MIEILNENPAIQFGIYILKYCNILQNYTPNALS